MVVRCLPLSHIVFLSFGSSDSRDTYIMASASSKWPPKLENDSEYEAWKKDISIWEKLTDLVEEKRALAIHLSLTGRARVASSELTVDELNGKDGVKKLIDKLDGLFLQDVGRRQFSAFHELYNLRRQDGKTMKQFICDFEHTYFKF